MGSRTFGKVEDFVAEDLVVAKGDRDLVIKALADLHVTIQGDEKEDDRLGLVLLSLNKDSLASAAAGLREDADLVTKTIARKWSGDKPDGIELSNLDLLLSKLCTDFGTRYSGWIPEIGKNRLISPVRGLPYISGCSEGDPSQLGLADPEFPVTADLGWPPVRPTEPGHRVQVGLLDTRLYQHPWLAGGYLAAQPDLFELPGPAEDLPWSLAGHATFIAGLILRQAPGARLIIRPVMEQRALGTTWGVATVMADFVGTGVDLLNLSFGCYTDDGQPPLVLAKAVSFVSPQILLVAAAGNHGNIEALRSEGKVTAPWTANIKDTTPVWPAAFPQVTAVGARDDAGVADFSPKLPWVDVTAPGVAVGSTYLGTAASPAEVRLAFSEANETEKFTGWARWTGTSFAAATVSGAVAAQIREGCSAQQALEAVLADSKQHPEIVKFDAPAT